MNGQVTRLVIGDILITPEGVKPFFTAEGKLKAMFTGF
jgi:quercetin dioxygenase-like cupin family protein